jgi:hypothetical protein
VVSPLPPFNASSATFVAPYSGVYTFTASLRFNEVRGSAPSTGGSAWFDVAGVSCYIHSCEGANNGCDGHRAASWTGYVAKGGQVRVAASFSGSPVGSFQADYNDRFTGSLLYVEG